MYQSTFGTKNQVRFNSESDYYELLGYLANSSNSTRIVWEKNDEQGAWGQEGRIEFTNQVSNNLKAILKHTAGNATLNSRVNCNDFIENIKENHNFRIGGVQNKENIFETVPENFEEDFERGYSL